MSAKREIIAPCDCKGSIKYVHKSCLKQWVLHSPNFPMKCQLCLQSYSIKTVRRPFFEIFKRLLALLKKHGLVILRDLVILKILSTVVFGTVFYLHNYHKDKESYALNMLLTAFVSRLAGVEFVQTVMNRYERAKMHLLDALYKRKFSNKYFEERQ